MSIHKNASAYKASKYTMDFPVIPFGNKNKQNAEKLPPTLSNCFIVNITSEKSKRKRCSNPLANTCKMQMKGWQEHNNKRHFIVNSPLSMGHFCWFINQPCFELWDTQPGSLFMASRACQFRHTQQYCYRWLFRYRKAQPFLTNLAGSKLDLCKDSLGIPLLWCGKCKLKVPWLQHRHINC